MARTFIRQATQIRNSSTYSDAVAAGQTAMVTNAASIEDDLNSLRSQVKRATGETNWYDAPTGRSLKALSTDLTDIENKKLLFRTHVLADIAVPAGQNFVVLTVSGSQAPSQTAAVGVSTANGAVVAAHGGTFGTTHSLTEVTGANAIQPKNLCVVRDATTGDFLLDAAGKQVYALLQSQVATDGHTFNDTTQKAQLSFVVENATADDLVACAVASIAGKTINYAYVRRINLDAIPEEAFLAGVFVDQAAAVDVTLDNAIDNQTGAATQTKSIDWKISDTFTLTFGDSAATPRKLIGITPNSAGDVVEFNVDTFDVNVTNADFSNVATFATSQASPVAVGNGSINTTTGDFTVQGNQKLTLEGLTGMTLRTSANPIGFEDIYIQSSTISTKRTNLADSTTEWNNFETKFGEVSIVNALVQAANSAARQVWFANVTANVAANVNVTGAGGTPNLDAALGAYTGAAFTTKVKVYLNGNLMRPGADAAANNDVYPGTTPANGDLMFEFPLQAGDVIAMEIYS